MLYSQYVLLLYADMWLWVTGPLQGVYCDCDSDIIVRGVQSTPFLQAISYTHSLSQPPLTLHKLCLCSQCRWGKRCSRTSISSQLGQVTHKQTTHTHTHGCTTFHNFLYLTNSDRLVSLSSPWLNQHLHTHTHPCTHKQTEKTHRHTHTHTHTYTNTHTLTQT